LFACAASLPAQAIELAGPVRTFATRLRSDNACTVAWAAFEIAEHRYASQKRELVLALQTWGNRDGDAAEIVRLHLLDALVRIGAEVPPADVLPHLHGITEVPAFVLLARDPRQNERELLALFVAPPMVVEGGRAWPSIVGWAAGNLLFAQRAPGFAAHVLGYEAPTLWIAVRAAGAGVGVGCGGCVDCGRGRATKQRLPGFPPVPVADFIAEPWGSSVPEGAVRLTPGPWSVHWRRTLAAGEYAAGGSRHNCEARVMAAFAMAITPPRLRDCRPSHYLEFTSEVAYVAEVKARRAVWTRWNIDLLEQLVADRWLTSAEATALAGRETVEIVDCRNEPAAPLPAVPDAVAHANR
jgi:hypothetical protein